MTAWHGTECELRLSPGVAIRGSVMDQDNRPIAGARVRLMSWFRYAENQAALARTHDSLDLEGHLVDDSIRVETKTKSNGSFRLEDLPEDRWVVLAISADDYLPRCVVADTGRDPALELASSTPRLFDQGIVRLQHARPIFWEVIAQDTGRPVPLKSAFTSPRRWLETNDPHTERARALPVQENRVTWDAVPPGGHRVWLIPDPATGYLATALDIDGEDPELTREQQVALDPGIRVIGRVVDDRTNAPLAGAAIFYETETGEEPADGRWCVPSVISDNKGEFSLVVPDVPGWLRQMGRVDGYRSVHLDSNVDIRTVAPSVRIVPVAGQETKVEIRLQMATRVIGQVVDLDGLPVPFARYAASNRVDQRNSGDIVGTADQQGRFELPNLFAEILMESEAAQKPRTDAFQSERIYLSSPDWSLTATVIVPRPEADVPDVHLLIVLRPAASIRGRVIDLQTGTGVSGVWISNFYRHGPNARPFRSRSATTNKDGEFTLTPVFTNSELTLYLQGEYVAHRRNQNDWLSVETASQVDLGEIPVYVYRDLETLLELPDLTSLTTEQAYEKLQANVLRIRTRIKEVHDWQGSRNSVDSISIAEMTTAERFGEAFLKLSQRTSDRDVAFQILSGLLLNLDTAWAPSFQASRAKRALLEQFLDRENLHEVLPRMIPDHDTKHWQYVFDHAKSEQLKAMACGYLIQNMIWNLPILASTEGVADQMFNEELARAESLWTYAFGEGRNRSSLDNSLDRQLEHYLRMILKEVESNPRAKARRTEQLQQAIRRHLPTPSGG